MSKEIQALLIKNNANLDLSDKEWINNFYEYLQGEHVGLDAQKAFSIIYYLQETLPVFPDNIERCGACNDLYDANAEGEYFEEGQEHNHYCDSCNPLT